MAVCKDLSPNPLPKVGGELEDCSEAFGKIIATIFVIALLLRRRDRDEVCSRKFPEPLGIAADAPASSPAWLAGLRIFPQVPQHGWQVCGCPRKLRSLAGKVAGRNRRTKS
jgi:hypothetical protein